MTLNHAPLGYRIGEGASAEVIVSVECDRFTKQPRLIAIKRALPHLLQHRATQYALRAEAELLRGLQHPHIVELLRLDQAADQALLVLEYLSGETVELVQQVAQAQARPMPPHLACLFAHDLCSALSFASTKRHGAAHGDLAPDNVMLSYAGQTKVIDFQATSSPAEEPTTSVPTTGVHYGYAAPETLQGAGCNELADLFSVGTMLWELLAGRRLFAAETAAARIVATLQRRIVAPSRFNSAVSRQLDRLVTSCLTRNPQQRRPVTTQGLCEALAGLLQPDCLEPSSSLRNELAQWLAALLSSRRLQRQAMEAALLRSHSG